MSYTKGVMWSQQAQESKLKPLVLREVCYSTAEWIQWLISTERGDPTFPSCLLVLLSSLLPALAFICSCGQLLNQLTLH